MVCLWVEKLKTKLLFLEIARTHSFLVPGITVQ